MMHEPKVNWGLLRIDLAGVVVLALLTAGVYYASVAPLIARHEAAASRQHEYEQKHAQARTLGTDSMKLSASIKRTVEDIHANPVQLESVEQLNRRVAAIASKAEAASLTVDAITPGDVQPRERLQWVPIKLSGRGGFPQCVRFLDMLRTDFPDTGVVALSIKGSPQSPDTPGVFHFDLIWYTRPEPQRLQTAVVQ